MTAKMQALLRRRLTPPTSYVVLIPSKNGEATLEQTLLSILSQTVTASQILVIDDASTDATPQILRKFEQVIVIRLEHNLPRDFARVPKLINLGLTHISQPCSYVMISGDDSLYPSDYVQRMMEEFEKDSRLYVCSGAHTRQRILDEASPHGSGRMIRYSFLKQVLPFPESIGWESWVLFKAQEMGGQIKRVTSVSFRHLRPYGSGSVWTFGQSMYELGYPFWFVFARFVKNVLLGPNRVKQLTMLGGFLEFKLKRKPRLDIADFVARQQIDRIRRILTR